LEPPPFWNHHPFGTTTLLAIRKQNNDACH
jgi:hypothetical protein